MLIDFTVKNYTSFKDEKTFSFLCNSKNIKDDIALINLENDKYKIYPFSVVLGPNASGKTNLFKALYDLQEFVRSSFNTPKNTKIEAYKPYKLNSSTIDAPTTFDIEFTSKGNHYSYKVIFLATSIISEELYLFNNGIKLTKSFLFKRENLNIIYGSKVTGDKAVFKTLLLPNKLLLSVIGESSSEGLIQDAHLFFINSLDIIFPQQFNSHFQNKYRTEVLIKEFPGVKKLVISLLKAADIQISDIKIINNEDIEKKLKEMQSDENIANEILINHFSNKTFFGHPFYDDNKKFVKDELLNFEDSESSGTNKLYELSGSIIMALLSGSILIIDQLSSCLHPNIELFIVELFLSKDINTKGAQLLINTHNANIIDNGNFTREQVWFTDRNNYGESDLFCLDEFDKNIIRDYAKYGKSYFENRMGGLPNICVDTFRKELESYYAQK